MSPAPSRQPRMTIATRLVLQALAGDPEAEHYGLEIGHAVGLASGTVHPILARLEAAGWVRSRWEDVDASAAGRPARRYYSLTTDGVAAARSATAAARRPRGFVAARPAVEA